MQRLAQTTDRLVSAQGRLLVLTSRGPHSAPHSGLDDMSETDELSSIRSLSSARGLQASARGGEAPSPARSVTADDVTSESLAVVAVQAQLAASSAEAASLHDEVASLRASLEALPDAWLRAHTDDRAQWESKWQTELAAMYRHYASTLNLQRSPAPAGLSPASADRTGQPPAALAEVQARETDVLRAQIAALQVSSVSLLSH